MIKNKNRSLNIWVCIVLASIIFSLAMSSTCLAASPDLKSTFKESEYKVQLQNLINMVNKINDDLKNGKISQDQANNTYKYILDDPQFNQIKIKKQIVEQEYNASINKKPDIIPGSPEFKKLKLSPDKITTTPASTTTSASTSYYYTSLDNVQWEHNGWGVGFSYANGGFPYPGQQLNWAYTGSRAEFAGSYYANTYFNKYIYAPRTGNAMVRADIDWTGGCYFPDVCSITFILYKRVSGNWQIINSGNIVSLTGFTGTSGPHNAYANFQAYMEQNAQYNLDIFVNTKASAYGPLNAAVADYGVDGTDGNPIVHFHQFKLTY